MNKYTNKKMLINIKILKTRKYKLTNTTLRKWGKTSNNNNK